MRYLRATHDFEYFRPVHHVVMSLPSKPQVSPTLTISNSVTSYNNKPRYATPSIPNHPRAPLPDRATSHSKGYLEKVAEIHHRSFKPTYSALHTRTSPVSGRSSARNQTDLRARACVGVRQSHRKGPCTRIRLGPGQPHRGPAPTIGSSRALPPRLVSGLMV